MASSPSGVKAGLFTLAGTLYGSYDDLLVSYGMPDGNFQANDIVAVLDQRLEVTRPTMATSRPREEQVQTLVLFSCWRAGPGADVQRTATERAWALFDVLADHFRTSPNETLSGACREAWVVSGELRESKTYSRENPEHVTGRVTDLTAVVTSKARN